MSSKMTVLQIVQSVLGAMDSDAVNSIGETQESEQIALVAKEVYYEIVTFQDIPQLRVLTQLTGLNDTDQATVMRIPTDATDIDCVKYLRMDSNGIPKMRDIRYQSPQEFLARAVDLNTTETFVGENILPGNVRVPYRNDRAPEYWTSFDDELLVFDAIDTINFSAQTLHNDASMCMAYVIPEFQLADTHIPGLPAKMFPQYLQQVKETAFVEAKQMDDPIQRMKADRSRHRNRHFTGINDGLDNGRPDERNFGRNFRGSVGLGRISFRRRSH